MPPITLTAATILADLKSKARETHRKTYIRHGMSPDRVYGVPMPDLQKAAKQIKGEQDLALELYDTGIIDAMYLAALVANGERMTKKQLQSWAEASGNSSLISEHAVPWVTAESPHGRALAIQWMGSKKDHVASCGWRAYSLMLSTLPDDELDLEEIDSLLDNVATRIHSAPNRVRFNMNGFVISVGTHVKPLLKQAKAAAKKIGVVAVSMGDTACKVPLATEYIDKNEKTGRTGEKRKSIR